MGVNEITGDSLVSKKSSDAYREGYDRIFGKKVKEYKLSDSIILRNSAKCLSCGDTIESTHRHDYVTCSCGNLSVDGGKAYIKRMYNSSYEDTSIQSDDLNVIREYFTWGTYGPNGDQPKYYIKLKDMTTEHIEAILETQQHIKGTYVEEVLKLELQYRKDNYET